MPRNDTVFDPPTYPQSPSSSDTTRGARSRRSVSVRSCHRPGGSITWESEEIIQWVRSTSAAGDASSVDMVPPKAEGSSRRWPTLAGRGRGRPGRPRRETRGPAMSAFNPFDPAQVDDQVETLARLRRESPVTEVVPG